MEDVQLNNGESKTNGDVQLSVIETGDVNNSTEPSTQEEVKKSGYLVTLMQLIKGNIGCGMLAMGQAFKLGGLYLTLSILLYVWAISVYNMHVLTSLSKRVQNHLQLKRAPSFGKTVENAFKMSDRWIFRGVSHCVSKVVLYNILITQFGLCSVYILFISKSLKELSYQYGYNINFQYVLLMTMPLIMVCASLRKLRFIAPLSTFANISLMTGVFTILYYSCSELSWVSFSERRYSYDNWFELPTMFGIIMFSFEGIGLVLPLFAEMKDDRKFTSMFGVLKIGMIAVMMLNVPLGMTGYIRWGDAVKDSLTWNLPNDQKLTQFVILMMMLGIACSYALQFYPAAVIVYRGLEKRYGPFNHPTMCEYSVRICLCLITYLAASQVPNLDLFMSLVGSVTCVALTMIFPALSDLAFPRNDQRNYFSKFMSMVTLFTAVVGSATGIYANSTAIYDAFTQRSNG